MKANKTQYEMTRGIVVDKKIRFGKPVIKGTRVPVDLIIGKLAGGMTFQEVIKEYGLTKTDLLNALNYAARLISKENIITP